MNLRINYFQIIFALLIFSSPICEANLDQLKIWNLREEGKFKEADLIEQKLETILAKDDFVIERALTGGRSGQNARLVKFANGVKGVLKETKNLKKAINEVAAFRVDRLLRFNHVPITVLRNIDGADHSIQLFLDQAIEPKINSLHLSQLEKVRFFDTLIAEPDRHGANFLLWKNRVVLIDHGSAFGFWTLDTYTHKTFDFGSRRMVKMTIPNSMTERMQTLTAHDLVKVLPEGFSEKHLEALVNRWLGIKKKFELPAEPLNNCSELMLKGLFKSK
jgi:hypothetical protein